MINSKLSMPSQSSTRNITSVITGKANTPESLCKLQNIIEFCDFKDLPRLANLNPKFKEAITEEKFPLYHELMREVWKVRKMKTYRFDKIKSRLDDEYFIDLKENLNEKGYDNFEVDDLVTEIIEKFFIKIENEKLDLGDKNLGKDYENLQLLSEAMMDKKITSLNLEKNDLGEDPSCLKVIEELLTSNNSITELNLSNNLLYRLNSELSNESSQDEDEDDDDNVFYNVISLNKNENFTLSKIVKASKTLQNLNLSRKGLGGLNKKYIKALSDSFKENHSIEILDLSYNYIEGDNLIFLCEALMLNTSITQLDISENLAEKDKAFILPLLKELVTRNQTITRLKFESIYLSREDYDIIAYKLREIRSDLTIL